MTPYNQVALAMRQVTPFIPQTVDGCSGVVRMGWGRAELLNSLDEFEIP
jgi:hypothetical protein